MQVNFENDGFSLNEAQREAVLHREGPLVVVAGPGSGKTRVITARVGALLKAGVNPSEVMVVTFTRAAASEMKARIAALDGVDPQSSSRLRIGTFHALFYKILKHYGAEGNIADDLMRRRWVSTALRSLGEEVNDDLVEELLSQISRSKNNLIDLQDLPKQEKLLKEVWVIYEQFKTESSTLDFDDLLVDTCKLLTTNRRARQEMQRITRYILVDEFQDTNRAQYEVLRILAAPENNICVVGDIDQAIYSWRGARPEFMLNFKGDYPQTKTILLSTNYRSTPEIIRLANMIISHNDLRHNASITSVRQNGAPPRLFAPQNERAEARSVLNAVKKQHERGIPLHDMAVFYRINKYNHHLLNLLVEGEVPFVVRDKERSLEEHWAVREVLGFLRLAVNPEDVNSLALVAKRGLGLDEQVVAEIRRGEGSLWSRVGRLVVAQKVAQFKEALRSASRMSPAKAMDYYLKEMGYASYLEWYAKRRGLPADEFTTMCNDLRDESEDYGDIKSFLGYIDRLSAVMKSARSEEGRHGALNLMTLHSAKGLEFNAVWIMGCMDGLLPHSRSTSKEEREEERRLFYVGCTRAKDLLCIMAPKEYRNRKAKESPFVKEAFKVDSPKPGPEQPFLAGSTQSPRTPTPRPSEGMKVVHASLGEGTVLNINQEGANYFVTVRFRTGTRKYLWGLSFELGTLRLG
jgi:DNA helicase-2/ATP-dependent DNA helicase PcrA